MVNPNYLEKHVIEINSSRTPNAVYTIAKGFHAWEVNNFTENVYEDIPGQYSIRVEGIVILALILCLWAFAVFLFLRKWASIRITHTVEARFRHTFKNLDTVRVVKRVQDSVIYKNYNRKISMTMVAREERRLQRMHSVPVMRTLPTIAMETTTEM